MNAPTAGGSFEAGQYVRYHPIIGEKHDGKEYRIRELGKLGHGEPVAWLYSKAGCVSLKAISLAECQHDHECVYDGWESSTYVCKHCGDSYKLYEDEMR